MRSCVMRSWLTSRIYLICRCQISFKRTFSCSAHESGKLRRQLSQERSSSPERSLWMILGERSVRRIVREICPESTPTVAARSLMLENFPSSIIFCHYHDHASNVIVLSRRSCSCRETREKKSSPVSFSIASTVTAKSCRGRVLPLFGMIKPIIFCGGVRS